MNRTASEPTSSTTSRSVTKSPECFDIRTCSPLRNRRTSCTTLTSSAALPPLRAHLTSRRAVPPADALPRRLHALDVAAVVGAEHVDHVEEAAIDLVLVIGDVGREIGIAAVRLDQRTIDVVAIGGGAEQRLDPVLVIVDRLTLRRRQAA